jgi:uncharacterized membrane protein YdjX (TVP38/TMEM64 family)
MSAAGAASKRRRRRPDWRKLGLLILPRRRFAAAWRYTPLKEFAPENITKWARSVREVWWAPIALVLAFTPAAVLMIPRPVLMLFAVIASGVWLGLAYAAAGIMPALAAWTVFGDQLARALEDPSKISWWPVALAIVVLAVFTYFVRQWFATQAAAQ